MALLARVVVPRRTLQAALLSLALAVALSQGSAGECVSVAATARPHASRYGLSSLPVAAQGPIAAAVGAQEHAYRVSSAGVGFAATNPAQRLQVGFGRSGVLITSGAVRFGLSLDAVGYGQSLKVFGGVAPRAKANRVVYERAGVSEWYVNGPLGLEQGFTIPRPPGHPAGPLTLSVGIRGNTHVALAAGGQSVMLRGAGGRPSLRYTGLVATDARGRSLHSWLQVDGGRVLLRVDTRGARYPLRIDPLIQQGSKLTGGGESGEGRFGWSVALSGDGNTALIAAPNDNEGAGAAWVFTRSGSTWSQQGPKLTGSEEGSEDRFGRSVALSSEGNTALIGGGGEVNYVGAAWVFTRSGSTWTQQGPKLTGGEESGEGDFGESVALSGEGNTALIGGWKDDNGAGAAWVFTRSGSTWTQQAKLTGGEESGESWFGMGMALSADGNTALIGGGEDSNGAGAAWVFTRSGSTWTQQGPKLSGGEESGAGAFGVSAALSSDGNTALIGGPFGSIGEGGESIGAGAAWVFTRSGSTWTQQGPKLTGGEESGEGDFGQSVSLSADGNTALIGGLSDNGFTGAAWMFARSGSTWTQQGGKLTGEGESGGAAFGFGVALSAEANTALIGGPLDNGGIGAAWVFGTGGGSGLGSSAPTVTGVSPSSGSSTGGTSVTITGTNFTGATAVRFGSTSATSFTVNSATSTTAVSPAGTGTVDVTVTNPAGASPVSSTDRFAYIAPASTTSCAPGSTTCFAALSYALLAHQSSGTLPIDCATSGFCTQANETDVESCAPSCGASYDADVIAWALTSQAVGIALQGLPCASLGADIGTIAGAAPAVGELVNPTLSQSPVDTVEVNLPPGFLPNLAGPAVAVVSLTQSTLSLPQDSAECAAIASTGAGLVYAVAAGSVGAIVTLAVPQAVNFTFQPPTLNPTNCAPTPGPLTSATICQNQSSILAGPSSTLYVTSQYQPPSDVLGNVQEGCLPYQHLDMTSVPCPPVQPLDSFLSNETASSQVSASACNVPPGTTGSPVPFMPIEMSFTGAGSAIVGSTAGIAALDGGIGYVSLNQPHGLIIADQCGRIPISYTPGKSNTEIVQECPSSESGYLTSWTITSCPDGWVNVPQTFSQDEITVQDPLHLVPPSSIAYTYPASSSNPDPPPPSTATSWVNSVSGTPTGTALADDQLVTAYATGEGGITVSQYGGDPVGPPSFDATDDYFDLRATAARVTTKMSGRIARSRVITSLTLRDCDLTGGTSIYWSQTRHGRHRAQWRRVSVQHYLPIWPACVEATIGRRSSPSLTQLRGTVFAVGVAGQRVYVNLLASKATTKHGKHTTLSAFAHRDHVVAHDGLRITDDTTGKVVIACGPRDKCVARLSVNESDQTFSAELYDHGRVDAASVAVRPRQG